MSITYAQNVGLVKMPPQVEIDGIIYRTVEVNGLVWIAEDLKNNVGSYQTYNGRKYYKLYGSFVAIDSILPTGWRRAVYEDYLNLVSYYTGHLEKLCSTSGWDGLGTNESGLAFEQTGVYPQYSVRNTENSYHGISNVGFCHELSISSNTIVSNFITPSSWSTNGGYAPIRVCRDA